MSGQVEEMARDGGILEYNSSYHTSLGCSPFKALYGIEPNFGALPNLGAVATPTIAEMAEERQAFVQLLQEHLLRAQARIKAYADKNRTERQFQVGDEALLKLQPYAQTTVVNRPCPKLAFKYFGPFKIVERIGAVAYKLELPQDCAIHPVFHVSQLKPFTPNYTPVYDKLPAPPDITADAAQPQAILERRMVKKGKCCSTTNQSSMDKSTSRSLHMERLSRHAPSFSISSSVGRGFVSRRGQCRDPACGCAGHGLDGPRSDRWSWTINVPQLQTQEDTAGLAK